MGQFTADGLTFDVHDAGPAGGEVAVLLHGFPQDHTAYDDVVPLLTARGLRVLVPDQRGYSPGARPRSRRHYRVARLVDDVAALLTVAGVGRAHLVGHDWGGGVAWAFAGRHPDRTASLTVLSTPHPAAMQQAMLRSNQALRSAYMLWFQLPWLPERMLMADDGARLRAALRRTGLPDDRAAHYSRLMAEGAMRGAVNWYRGIPLGRSHIGRTRVPTVLVHGRRDPFFAPLAIRATAGFVSAPFEAIGVDAGHWLPETHPREVAEAVLRAAGR